MIMCGSRICAHGLQDAARWFNAFDLARWPLKLDAHLLWARVSIIPPGAGTVGVDVMQDQRSSDAAIEHWPEAAV
jgi:hypothetical protein